MKAYLLDPLLPWDILPEEKNRSKKITTIILMICMVFTAVVPFLPLPEEDRSKQETLPPRLAKLVMKKKIIKKPPPPPKEEKKKEEPKKEKKKEEKKEKKPEKKKKKPPKEAKKRAREVAKKHIAVFDALADLRDTNLPTIRPKKLKKGKGKENFKTDRSIITSAANSRSGGIVTAKASTGNGGSKSLEGVDTTQVESKLVEVQASERKKRSSAGTAAQRTPEDIEFVIQQNKGAIYGIYNRFLRKDPNLEGTIVLHLVIAPDGSVTLCEIVSSDLENSAMERKLIARIKLINFGSNSVGTWDSTYPITFIPS